ncbi:MAG: ATP-binding protein [Burkholderiaceae bacterium]|jgi:nicotinamide riboside kinase|nr:ATP-binding protein [Burkholderiaceae bacterium]
MSGVRRVAIIGAECVGKSELALRLARVLPGLAIAEYLREFCERMRRTPLPQEQGRILAEQRRREDEAVASAQAQGFGWVLADSAPLVTAAYSEFLFADHSLHDGALAHHAHYHATLLLAPDLPWVADGIQRDGPAVRQAFHALLLRRLQEAQLDFALIGGVGEQRLLAASQALLALQSAPHARGPA